MIATLTYSDLITTTKGRDAARVLLNTVINQQISYQISVDAISEILQQRCGSFCSADDVMQYKVSLWLMRCKGGHLMDLGNQAMENLKRAKETPPKSKERTLCLREAIRCAFSSCPAVDDNKLIALQPVRERYPQHVS